VSRVIRVPAYGAVVTYDDEAASERYLPTPVLGGARLYEPRTDGGPGWIDR
jgi:hypothetical protein